MDGYHKAVALRAWAKTMSDVTGTWPARFVSIAAMLGTFAFMYLWVAYVDKQSEALKDYQVALIVSAGVGASLFVFGFLINAFWLVPWDIWVENKSIISEQTERLTPRLTLKNVGPQNLKKIEFGNSLVTLGGRRQIVIQNWSQGVFLTVENPSSETITNCQAYLARFAPIETVNEQWESLRLAWVPAGDHHDSIDLPSGGSRSIWLFSVINNMLQFRVTTMPVQMISAIQPKGEYEGLIVLSGSGVAASHIPFTLLCDGPENPPILTITNLGS